jgi:hypothetical protein
LMISLMSVIQLNSEGLFVVEYLFLARLNL